MTTTIKPEWNDYYNALEAIRRSGIVNMYGASPYLAEFCEIDEDLAREVLKNWMTNYGKLSSQFGWN